MQKIISYGLWGFQEKYIRGAIRNAELSRHVYPNWKCRFYISEKLAAAVEEPLRSRGADVTLVSEEPDWTAMFWRMRAASIPECDRIIFRDADSRITEREAKAVEEWIAAGCGYHIMRDHPAHNAPIQGGMWGIFGRENLNHLVAAMANFSPSNCWGSDQDFLSKLIFRRALSDSCVHDEFFVGRPFPTPREGLNFVGASVDQYGDVEPEQQRDLEAWYRLSKYPEFNKRLRPKTNTI